MIPLRDMGVGGAGNGAASYSATTTASGQSVSDAVRRGSSFVFAGIGMCLLSILGGMGLVLMLRLRLIVVMWLDVHEGCHTGLGWVQCVVDRLGRAISDREKLRGECAEASTVHGSAEVLMVLEVPSPSGHLGIVGSVWVMATQKGVVHSSMPRESARGVWEIGFGGRKAVRVWRLTAWYQQRSSKYMGEKRGGGV